MGAANEKERLPIHVRIFGHRAGWRQKNEAYVKTDEEIGAQIGKVYQSAVF